jgi:hypothetical protein
MNAANPQASVLDLVPRKQRQARAVGRPVSSALGGNANLPVKVYALGTGVSIAAQGEYLALAEGAFQLEACGRRFVIDPLKARVAYRFVAPIEGDISTLWHEVYAVDQEHLPEVGTVGHGVGASKETAILSLPAGWGKPTIARAMGARIGCTHVVDEWLDGWRLFPGALHLTNSGVSP